MNAFEHAPTRAAPADPVPGKAELGTAQPRNWSAAAPAELIDHILARYHQRHRQQLPNLLALARRVELVHAGRPGCPTGLAELLRQTQQELESHMMKEEQVLFPMLARGLRADGPVTVMRFEHRQHGEALERIDALTAQLNVPADACNTWRKLYADLAEFRDDLLEHIALENDFLFQTAATETNHA